MPSGHPCLLEGTPQALRGGAGAPFAPQEAARQLYLPGMTVVTSRLTSFCLGSSLTPRLTTSGLHILWPGSVLLPLRSAGCGPRHTAVTPWGRKARHVQKHGLLLSSVPSLEVGLVPTSYDLDTQMSVEPSQTSHPKKRAEATPQAGSPLGPCSQ